MGVIRKILSSRSSKNGDFFIKLQDILGFTPKNLHFYQRAFTHASLQKKDQFGNDVNYERLEFLGDAVLGAVVAAYLFEKMPVSNEGNLTQMRSKIVNRQTLNELGQELKLTDFLDQKNINGKLGDDVHGNLFEAFIGAIYMDKGYKSCQRFIIKRVISDHLDIHRLKGKIMSYKSFLIEWCQKEKKDFNFVNCEDSGKESVKHFSVKFMIDGSVVAKARSTSKKKAEEKAAQRAYFALQNKFDF